MWNLLIKERQKRKLPDRRCVGVRVQKNLKSKILSLIATVICLTIALSCFSLPVLATTGENEDNALMVGVPADRCPVFYLDVDTGEIVGIGVDLMRAVAENAGYDVSFIRVKEATLKEALDNEAYDVLFRKVDARVRGMIMQKHDSCHLV